MSDAYTTYAGFAQHASLEGFAVTEFSIMFRGRQPRQGVKFLQRRKDLSNALNVRKESVPAALEKLYNLTLLSARGHFIGSYSTTSDNRFLNLVTLKIFG